MPAANHCPTCQAELPVDAPAGLCPACLLKAGMTSDHFETGNRTHGPTFTPPTPAELAPHFPQIEVLELIGQGGMGAVYRAKQARLDRFVALKILPKDAEKGQEFADRFNREAKAMARLNHPNIIAIHDYGEAGGWFYFVMEYVDGVNLRQAMKSATIQPPDALAIVGQICDALQYAHDENVVHRDIKPENILLTKKGRVKIADFGLAKLLGLSSVDRHLTATQQVMGTVGYMAPEQMEGSKAIDHRADIYALGVVFYELLTGELPMGRFAPPSQKVQIDVRIDEVVLKSLEREPDRRYQSASQVKHEMDRISAGQAIGVAASPAPVQHDPLSKRLTWLGIVLLTLGILELTAGVASIFSFMHMQVRRDFLRDASAPAVQVGYRMVWIDFLGLSWLVVLTGVLILSRRLRALALIGTIAAMIPLATVGAMLVPNNAELMLNSSWIEKLGIVGVPLGIWGLVELMRPESGALFRWPILPLLAAIWRGPWTSSASSTVSNPHSQTIASATQSHALEAWGVTLCVLSCVLFWPFYGSALHAIGFEPRFTVMSREYWIAILLPSIVTGLALIIAGPLMRNSALIGLVMLLGGIAQLAVTLWIVPEAPSYLNTWLMLILGTLLGLLGAWRLRWCVSGAPMPSSATTEVALNNRPRRRWFEWSLAFVGVIAAIGASAWLAHSIGWLQFPSSSNVRRLNKQMELQAQLLGNWTKAEGPEFHVVSFRNDGTFDEQTANGTVSGQYSLSGDDRVIIEAPRTGQRIVNVVIIGEILTLKELNGSVLRFRRSNPIPPQLP